MALNAKKVAGGEGKKFAPQKNIEAGVYPGRVVQIIDFGMQPQKPYAGKDKPPAQVVGVTYELVDEFMKTEEGEDILDKPRWVSEQFPLRNLKADGATSTQRIKALDPNDVHDGDLTRSVGQAINITIVNNKKGDITYDNVASLSPMRPRDAAACPELINPTKVFVLDEPDLEVFNSFPEWIRDKIKGNLNFKGSKLEKLLEGKPADEKKVEAPKKEVARDDDPAEANSEDDDSPF